MTAVCLHQPNFIPWTKLLAKIAASDVYVAYDSVQFTRTEYHNRQRLRARRGPILLTVPVRREETGRPRLRHGPRKVVTVGVHGAPEVALPSICRSTCLRRVNTGPAHVILP